MTADQLAQEIGSLWDALALAGQGAFTNAHPANGHKSPRDSARALAGFSEAMATAHTIITKLTRDYSVRIQTFDTEALLAIEQERQEAEMAVSHVLRQLAAQVGRAIRTGATGGPATLLHDSHGGIGMLVGKSAGVLRISIRDSSERQWKNPRRLVETIIRSFAVQAQVIGSISDLRAKGHTAAQVGQDEYPLHEIEAMRAAMFHPNSKELPRAIVPA